MEMLVAMVAFAILGGARIMELLIVPNFFWNMFGGACLALSIIAPGMSASVLMLPLQMKAADGSIATFYEHITGETFVKENTEDIAARIEKNVTEWLTTTR